MTVLELRRLWKWILRESSNELSYYGLDQFVAGKPVVLYHGTTSELTSFDINKSRKELVDKFTGVGIFLTPSKKVAWDYATSSRNKGFPESLVGDLKKVNGPAGEFLEFLVKHGQPGWELFWKKHNLMRDNPPPGEGQLDTERFKSILGNVDPNTIMDVAQHVIGTAYESPKGDDNGLLDLFGGTSSGTPDWLYASLDELGLDSSRYRPKVYKVSAHGTRVLVTSNQEEARRAFANGYDAFVFTGEDLVGGVPEVAVIDGNQVEILDIETES